MKLQKKSHRTLAFTRNLKAFATAGAFVLVTAGTCNLLSLAASGPGPFGPPPTPTPTPTTPQTGGSTPPPTFTPPPVVNTPAPQVPVITAPPAPFFQPIVVPTDVTSANPDLSAINTNVGQPLDGLMEAKSFPGMDELGGNPDFILVNGDETSYKRETPYLVNLLGGTILVSVKRPSQIGMLNTPVGEVAFSANADAFVNYDNGVVRIRNVDGMGQTVKIRLDKGPFAGANAHTYSLAPGYELVLGEHKLGASELRPIDGILRRRSQTINDGFAAISQFQVQSALQSSAVIPKLVAADSDAKSKRVLGDMSRMAAVLNHVNGADGYAR